MSSFLRDDKLAIRLGENPLCQEKPITLLHCGTTFKAIALPVPHVVRNSFLYSVCAGERTSKESHLVNGFFHISVFEGGESVPSL